jgi:hypothetical protein
MPHAHFIPFKNLTRKIAEGIMIDCRAPDWVTLTMQEDWTRTVEKTDREFKIILLRLHRAHVLRIRITRERASQLG